MLNSSYNLLEYGAIGDGLTNNKEIFKNIFISIQDYESVYIPEGNFLIKLTDNDLINIYDKNMYSFLKIENRKNIKIYGSGQLTFDCSQCTKHSNMMWIKNCTNISINGLSFVGDAKFNENIEVWNEYIDGITIENCENFVFNNNVMSNIMACLITTGERLSPTQSNITSNDIIIVNNIFENYGQISTFGSGVSKFIFSGNICKNALQCGIKLSTNVSGHNCINNSYDIIIKDNIFSWDENYKFCIVGWDTSKSFSPVGIMIECHSTNISITNNTCDLSRIKQSIQNPVQNISCISIYKGNSDSSLYNRLIKIENNLLIGYAESPTCISAPSFTQRLIIKENTCVGNINIGTYEVISEQMETIEIKNNFLYSENKNIGILIGNVWYAHIILDGNLINPNMTNSSQKNHGYIELKKCRANELNISNNQLSGCNILSYESNPLDIFRINIDNNKIKSNYLYLGENVNLLNIVNNIFNSNKTINLIRAQNPDTTINFCNNTGYTNGSVINLNIGRIRMNNNSIESVTKVQYQMGSSFIISGIIIGYGSPEGIINAMYGSQYIDFSSTQKGLYIKTTYDESTGWIKLIGTVDRFV